MNTILAEKYEILRKIGAGGMGIVYEARRIEDDLRVAIKQLPAIMMTKDDPRLPRFHREARATAAIDSEHVARIIDTGEDLDTGVPFIVMELLTGEDLEAVLTRVKTLTPATALKIAGQVCKGLASAHEARVVHRDIKPANIFLARDDNGNITVKILDFGIAKTKAEPGTDTTGMTRSGSMLGSPLYMSPEQARGIKEIDYRTDLWSLGIVIYRALCGSAPNEGISAFGDLIMAICSRPPALVQVRAPWVGPEIAAIVHRALRIEPDERFSNADEMLAQIQKATPEGLGLTEAHFGPLREETRQFVAPRYELTTEPGKRRVVQANDDGAIVDAAADTVVDEMQNAKEGRNSEQFGARTAETETVPGWKRHGVPAKRKTNLMMMTIFAVGVGGVAFGTRMIGNPSNTSAAPSSSPELQPLGSASSTASTAAEVASMSPPIAEATLVDAAALSTASASTNPSMPASASAAPVASPAPISGQITPRTRTTGNTAPPAPSVTNPPPTSPTPTATPIHDKFE